MTLHTFSKSISRLFLLLSVALLFLTGCDSNNEDFVFTNTQVAQANTLNLTVGFDPAALARSTEILGQINANVTQFRATLIDSNDNTVDQQTAGRTQTITFTGLSAGNFLVRFEGLDAGGNVVGYFDRIVTLNDNVTTLLPALIPDATPPAASFATTQAATTPFFLFTSVPTTAQGITGFDVSAQVFDGQGNPSTSATTGVSLTSSNLAFDSAVANQDTAANGSITFSAVRFEATANGTTTLTIAATGVDSTTSPDITVTPPGPFFATIELISDAINGTLGNASTFDVAISGDGNVIAFDTGSDNLVTGDNNGERDIFVRDRQANTLEIVSRSSTGTLANDSSVEPALSSDGRYVAFVSSATNLVDNDTNDSDDIFVYDRQTSTIERVSLLSNGTQGDSDAFYPDISDDGSIVIFLSRADNFDEGTPNGLADLFAYDRTTDTLERISMPSTIGLELRPSISGDGRFVAFTSPNSEGLTDTNGNASDIFVYDRTNDTVVLASTDAGGTQGAGASNEPSLSTDGSLVAFHSRNNFGITPDDADFDVFVKNLGDGSIERMSQSDAGASGDGDSQDASMSGDGRFVTFRSAAEDLIGADGNAAGDVFLFDRNTDTIQRVSVSESGNGLGTASNRGRISSDGTTIIFSNTENGVVAEDTNNQRDVFVLSNPSRR